MLIRIPGTQKNDLVLFSPTRVVSQSEIVPIASVPCPTIGMDAHTYVVLYASTLVVNLWTSNK